MYAVLCCVFGSRASQSRPAWSQVGRPMSVCFTCTVVCLLEADTEPMHRFGQQAEGAAF
ncbi:hypothetical protein LX32DRAFT_644515 [Colletotrichum zoysiae]|uniref:Uncharacterized protein n=1 Tax=Colletotrichum zoysiae TaxID=1216348 RepID=A0AAD9LW94_9PEZI|nr:hypothetical protein LX32DRAFT_644515 [Colletotrichum zoysiae]